MKLTYILGNTFALMTTFVFDKVYILVDMLMFTCSVFRILFHLFFFHEKYFDLNHNAKTIAIDLYANYNYFTYKLIFKNFQCIIYLPQQKTLFFLHKIYIPVYTPTVF